jgi:curved DNA-binding protein
MARKDPYDILGVKRGASEAEIKAAYRRLAKQHHPDRNPGDKKAEGRFKEVQAAYEVLGDKERRKQYDRFGEGGPRPDFAHWNQHQHARGGRQDGFDFGDMGDLSSIFEQFFGGRGGSVGGRRRGGGTATMRPSTRGADIEVEVRLSFDEAARGAARRIDLSDPRTGGSDRIEFRVPPGVSDGQRVRVKGKGQPGEAGRGDLMIRCRIAPHPWFRRAGLDVYLDLPLSIAEATLGAKVDVPTLDGVTTLSVPPGASSGAKLRLRGKGVHDPRAGSTGDMYAVVKVVAPRDLSERARELLGQFAAEVRQDPRKDLAWPV